MKVELLLRPSNTAAKIYLNPGETIISESGSMIAMSGDMSITTTTHKKNSSGGILSALKRLLANESFFLNEFTAGSKGGEVFLSTDLCGDMKDFETKGETLIVQAGSFVACEENVQMEVGWQGQRTRFQGCHPTGHRPRSRPGRCCGQDWRKHSDPPRHPPGSPGHRRSRRLHPYRRQSGCDGGSRCYSGRFGQHRGIQATPARRHAANRSRQSGGGQPQRCAPGARGQGTRNRRSVRRP